jgi:hypothetical protein
VPSIGDRVRFESTKVGQVPRDGVVTGVDGELLHGEWSTGGESSLVPGAGSIAIVGKVSGKTAAKRTIKKPEARKAAKKPAPAKNRTPALKVAKKAAKKSGPAKRTPGRKAAKKAVKKRAPARKRPAKRLAHSLSRHRRDFRPKTSEISHPSSAYGVRKSDSRCLVRQHHFCGVINSFKAISESTRPCA